MQIAFIAGEVKESVRNDDATGPGRKVVVEGLDRFGRVDSPMAVQVAQKLLFLRVHADHGLSRGKEFLFQRGDAKELLVAIGRLFPRDNFGYLSKSIIEQTKNAANDGRCDREIKFNVHLGSNFTR